ncbi:hypothetical protein SAMN02799624_01573 [Paenibacillus sp. UNC496MF]|uniref:hypothetical protein n=1 Tax=Paenibacillus sp. UNC496MF TaxID=1502753 RepID=UPI0008EEE644|nr:hypothetical protein [Paenibacillus sp. UNC496MF]SFI59934.1 hypothetical protein SAMN02799624_01573 [Paenibacillus sp. UNC496MF]
MNRYLKLVHWEIMRFWKLLAGLAALTAIVQCAGMIREASRYSNQVQDHIRTSNSTLGAFVQANGKYSFLDAVSQAGMWIYGPIALCAGILALYVFMIWYKEWYGKNVFVYRLLMLPTARRNIYFAKLTAILLFVFAFIGLQLALLPLENRLFVSAGGTELFEPTGVFELVRGASLLALIIPGTFTDFLLVYGIGAIVVLVCFTGVLLERSYRLKGAAAAVLYVAGAFLFLMLPYLILGRKIDTYLYPGEFYGIEFALLAIVAAVTVWLGLHLITKKVSV